MQFSNSFAAFVNSGKIPSTDREKSALLDEARSVISSITKRVASGELTVTGPQAAVSAGARQFATQRVTNPTRTAATVAKTVAVAQPTGNVTGADFTASQSQVMPRTDFTAMTPKNQAAFMKSGGKLV